MLLHPYFKLKGIEPGVVIHPRFGAIDFRKVVPFEKLRVLYETGSRFIGLTKEGEAWLHPKTVKGSKAVFEALPEANNEMKISTPLKKRTKRERKN